MLRLPAPRQSCSRVAFGAAAAVALAMSLSGCGGDAKAAPPPAPAAPIPAALQGDPTQVLAASAGRTVAAKNAGVGLTVPVFQEGQLTSVNGEGTVDFSNDRLRLVVPNAEKAEERQFGRTLFVLLPEQAGPALGGKKWVQLKLDSPQPTDPDPFRLYAYDPEQLLTAVTSVADAKIVGTEPVRGANTTHYTGSLDPAQIASSGVDQTFATAFTKATKGAATPIDVWLDDTGLVRRISLSLAPPNATLPAGSNPLTQVEFYDFGTANVTFTQPPASEVAGVADLSGLGGHGD